MFIHQRDGEPIVFAGLWEVWKDRSVEDAPWLLSCAIVTTRANAIDGTDPRSHAGDAARECVGLPGSTCASRTVTRWIRCSFRAADETIELWPVSTTVNNAGNNGPELVDRVESVEPEPPNTLFS